VETAPPDAPVLALASVAVVEVVPRQPEASTAPMAQADPTRSLRMPGLRMTGRSTSPAPWRIVTNPIQCCPNSGAKLGL
jgi:hypothetical protein